MPNSLDLNPVDYKVWSVIHEKVYKERIKDVDELRSRVVKLATSDQRVIDRLRQSGSGTRFFMPVLKERQTLWTQTEPVV